MLRPVLFLCAALLWLLPVHALEAPEGRVLLRVYGDINARNADDHAAFDRALLQALDWREIESYSDFFPGKERIAGPTLSSLLDVLGVEGGTLHATALDDFMIRIPVADAAEFDVIMALDRDGVPMKVRHKGPIWIFYPAPAPSDLNELHSSRMIWQLTHILVEQ